MKAAVFYEKHKLKVEDIPVKEPGEDEVLIRVHYCGVCGTDVHIYEGDEGSADISPGTVPGHELSGDVWQVGAKVTRFKKGDRVSVDPNDYCGTCYFCAGGRKHLCENMVGIGTSADGGFAEYITVPEHLVFRVPDSLGYEAAAMIEPVSCCLHGMELTDVRLGDTVMVVGCGNIGLIMVQLSKYMGASKIIAVEPSGPRRKRAADLGADVLLNPVNDDTEKILKENHIVNIDKVIDCAGRINTAQYSVRYAGKGATVMFFGLTGPEDVMELRPFEMFRKELTLKASFVNPNTFGKAIRILEAGIVKVEHIIGEKIPLSRIDDVFRERLYARDGKVLIQVCEDDREQQA